MPFSTRRSSTRGTPRRLLGRSGAITRHSKSVRPYRLMHMLNQISHATPIPFMGSRPRSRCIDRGTGINLAKPQIIFESPMSGTSIAYLTDRLRRAERFDLLDLVACGRISTYAAAEAAGFLKRRPTPGGGSPNAAKRRAFVLRRTVGR